MLSHFSVNISWGPYDWVTGIVYPLLLLPRQVIATHLYQGEDEDELSFEKGATIYVVPYDDPDDEVKYMYVSGICILPIGCIHVYT